MFLVQSSCAACCPLSLVDLSLDCSVADVPKDIEAETFKQLSRENFPPMGGPPMGGGRGPRGGGGPGGNFGGDERWQSGRLPSGPVPGGPPGMRGGDPRMMGRQPSGRQPRGGEAWHDLLLLLLSPCTVHLLLQRCC